MKRVRRGSEGRHLSAVVHPHRPGGSSASQRLAALTKPARPRALGLGTAFEGIRSRRAASGQAEPVQWLGPRSTFVLLIVVVCVLAVIGLVMVLSASSVVALRQDGSPWVYFIRQVIWVGLGGLAMLVTSRIDYRRWRRASVVLMVVSVMGLLAVLVPGVGYVSDGSSRWIGFGPVRIQPSELMKLALVVFLADLLARRADRMGDWRATFRPVLIVVLVAGVLVMKQPDMGTMLVLGSITFAVLFTAGTPLRRMAGLSVFTVVAAFVAGIAEPYRRARLLSFVNPMAHRSGSGYQVVQSLVGLGSGGLLGVGLGASRAKWGFLPNAYTDFIFSIIGEELGLIGSLLVVGLFAALAVLGIRVAARSSDRFGALLAAGITCWIVAQAVINIGAVIGLLPVAGVPLPFVSYGGSSMVLLLGATGILLNIAGQERAQAEL